MIEQSFMVTVLKSESNSVRSKIVTHYTVVARDNVTHALYSFVCLETLREILD